MLNGLAIAIVVTKGYTVLTAGGRGQSLTGKRGQGKGKMAKKWRKIEKGKVENWKWKEEKLQNEERTFLFFFFSFFLFTFQNHWHLFWAYQNGNFLPGKKITQGKIRKNDFPPSEKYYVWLLGYVYVFEQLLGLGLDSLLMEQLLNLLLVSSYLLLCIRPNIYIFELRWNCLISNRLLNLKKGCNHLLRS